MALTVVSEHMVFEDAMALLSYASPYPVLLHLEKNPVSVGNSGTLQSRSKLSSTPASGPLSHPAYRSQSTSDLAKVFLF